MRPRSGTCSSPIGPRTGRCSAEPATSGAEQSGPTKPGTNLAIATKKLTSGTLGAAWSATLTLSGTGPLAPTWKVFGLPPGLSATGAGVISGKPTAAGSYTVEVLATARSGGGVGSHAFSLAIARSAQA